MSIFRKFTRKQEKSKTKSIGAKELIRDIGMSLFMLSYAIMPKLADAEELASVNTTYTQGGTNVTDIYAQKVFNTSVAVNRFENFNVGEKTIANMHFKEENGTTVASNLFNFVQNNININGTVNAIRNINGNNKVGGNLYFLTPNSIVVGSQGVINAGAVTLMSGGPFPKSEDSTDPYVIAKTYAENIKQGKYLLNEKEYGNVTINGTINATDYISIGSSKSIFVGKAKDATNAPKLNTNATINFENLVNITDNNGKVITDARLGKDLVLTRTAGNGNIMLAARSDKSNARNAAIDGWMTVAGDNTVKAEVTVGQGAEIKSDAGHVSITAEAVRSNDFGNLVTFGDIGAAEAVVNVDGTVEGRSVGISADVTNVYKKNVYEKVVDPLKEEALKGLGVILGNISGLEDIGSLRPVFIGNKSNSSVTIGSHADINAKGGNVGINAASSVNIKSNGSVKSNGTEGGANIADASFVYTYIDNDATINVQDGAKIKSDVDSVNLNADALTVGIVQASAKKDNDPDRIDSDKFSAAVLLSRGDTKSKVTVGENSTIEAGTTLNIGSSTLLYNYNNAFVINNDATYINTAIQALTSNSESVVDIKGQLTSKGEMKISAYDSNSLNTGADNYVVPASGETPWDMKYTDASTVTKAIIKGIAKLLKSKPDEAGNNNADNEGQRREGAGVKSDYLLDDTLFSLGASINVVKGKHEARVDIGEKARLTSHDKLTVSASKIIGDLNVISRGATFGNNDRASINGSVAVIALDNSADVNIKGNDKEHAILTGDAGLYLVSGSQYEWNRPKVMVQFIIDCWKDLEKDFVKEGYGNVFDDKDMKKLKDAIDAYDANPSSEAFNAIQQAASESGFWAKLNTFVKYTGKIPSDVLMLWNAAKSFADPTSYVNVNVGSVANTYEPEKYPRVDTEYDIAGSIAVSSIKNRSRVFVGKDVELTTQGGLVAKATASQVDANYYGSLSGVKSFLGDDPQEKWKKVTKLLADNFEFDLNVLPAFNTGKNVVGGNIGVDNNTIQSSVVVSEGAKLTGAVVNLESDTKIKKIVVNPGGGKAKNFGYNGMFSILDYNTGSLVLVDDEATITANTKDGVNLKANNDGLIVNVVGDLTGGSSAIGVAAEYAENNVNTIAAVVDIDKDTATGKYAVRQNADEATNLGKLVDKFLTNEQKAMLGTTNRKVASSITAPSLNITATSSPKIWDFAVAGAIKTDTPQPNPPQQGENENNDGENLQADPPQPDPPQPGREPNRINDAGDIVNVPDLVHDNNQAPLNNVGANNNQVSGTTILGAGAVAIEKIYGTTASLLENNIVKMVDATGANRGVSLKAEDTALVVGMAGAFAVNKNVTAPATGTYMIGGTSAYNHIDLDTISQIKNSNIINAAAVSNYAHQEETLASVAAPLAIDVSKGTKGFSAALNLSVNKVDNDVHANMVDNQVRIIPVNDEDVPAYTSVQNTAYDNSSQGTGAANVDVSKGTVGLGINAVWAELNNDVKAKVQGGLYDGISNFDNNAATKLTQITLAVGVGVGSGDSAKGNGGAVWTHGKIKNDVAASIIGSDTNAITIDGGSLTNRAFDGTVGDGGTTTNKWRGYLTDFGVDITGEDTEKNLTTDNLDTAVNLDTDVDTNKLDKNVELAEKADYDKGMPTGGDVNVYTNKQLSFNVNKGNKIYTGAIEVAGTAAQNSKATLSVAVADNTLDNDYKAEISNASITLSHAKGADILAKSDSYVADFAVGVAASVSTSGNNIVGGAGSAAVATLDNDTIATVTKSTIESAKTSVKADTTTEAVSVAGSIGISGGKSGVGLAFAINQLDNETKAAIYGGTLKGYNGGSTAIDVIANSKSTATAVGTSVAFNSFQGYVGVEGNVTVNTGKNDTKAEIEQSGSGENAVKNTITNARSVQVKATDNNTLKAAAAGLNVSGGKANVGIGFAVNAINEQTLAARLNNATITSAANGTDIDVTTNEDTKVTTVGLGIGFSTGESMGSGNGYGAITLTKNKVNIAEVKNTTQTDANKKTDILVEAKANNKIVSTADALDVSSSATPLANIGFAGSGVDLKSDVKANLENSILNAMDAYVHADSADKIYNVGIGGVGSNSVAFDIANSTTVNKLNNDVKASIKNSTVKAYNSVGVVANSNDVLTNIAGGLSVGWKSLIGVGLSVGVNDISGDTIASISGSTIEAQGEAQGAGGKTYKDHEFTMDAEKNKMSISEKEHKGLLVDAYSKHDITNVSVTAGAMYGEDGDLVLTGVGNSNKLSGKTEALVSTTDVNKDTQNKGDVSVTAVEYTDINDVAINANVGISEIISANAGGSVSVSTLDRTINAKITGDEVADAQNRKVVNADKLIVEAGAKDDVDLITLGISVGGTKTAAVGIAALVDSLSSTYKVNSEISNINSVNSGLTFLTAHDGRLNYKGIGVTASVGKDFTVGLGATVGVMKDNNTLTGTVRNAELHHDNNYADDELSVTNYSEATPDLASVVASGSLGFAASVGVAVDNHTKNDNLKLEVVDSDLGSADKFAQEAKFKVDNYYKVDKVSVNLALAGAKFSGGVGVLVQPIALNSGNALNITGSNVYADKLTINDKETRDVKITAVNAAAGSIVGVGVNRNFISMGTILNEVYSTSKNDAEGNAKSAENLQTLLNTSNTAIEQAENIIKTGANGTIAKLNTNKNQVVVDSKDISATVDEGHRASRGEAPAANGENSASIDGQAIVVSNSNLTGKDIKIDSEVKDDVELVSGAGGLGAISVNVNASRIDETIKNNINIYGGSILADNLSILNHVTGDSYVHAVIAQGAAIGVNVGYADIYANGGTGITIGNANANTVINTNDSLLIRSLHDSTYKARTEGGSLAGAAGTYVEAESSDSLNNTITVTNTKLGNNAKRDKDSAAFNTMDKNAAQGVKGAMEIAAIKSSVAKTETVYGNVALALGIGLNNSNATINGNSSINLNNNIILDKLHGLSDTTVGEGVVLDSYALFDSIAYVNMTYGGGNMIGGGGVEAHANNTGGATITATGNTFDVSAVNAKAITGGVNELAKVKADAYNISMGVGVGKNKIYADVTTTTAVDFINNHFGLKGIKVVDNVEYIADTTTGKYNPFYTYKNSYIGKTDVNLDAETKALAHAEVLGVNVGTFIAVGHNGTESNTTETTRVTMNNSGLQNDTTTEHIDESRTMLNSLTMQAVGLNDVYNYADGRGGGILGISPDAADAKNTSKIITDANLIGKFDVNNKVNVTAAQTDLLTVYTNTEMFGIAVGVGGAEANNIRDKDSETAIKVNNSEINADSVSLIAYNDIRFNNYKKSGSKLVDEHNYAAYGNTGSIVAAETDLKVKSEITEKALVDINSTNIQTKKDIDIGAGTKANLFVAAQGSAEAVLGSGLSVKADSTYNYSDTINVTGSSILKTTTAEGDITLDAVDDTVLQTGAYADAAIGVATSPRVETKNTTTRSNIINIGSAQNSSDKSKLDSSNDVKLYAGRYDGVALAGLKAVIDSQTFSGALLIPASNRKLNNSIVENNVVNLYKNTLVKSVADTDIYADEGVMDIKTHKFGASSWTSDDPEKVGSSYVRTDSSQGNAGDVSLTQNNKVTIDGDVIAGNNHSINLVIGTTGNEDGTIKPEFVVLQDDLRTPFKESNPSLNVVAKPTITVNGKTGTAISKDVFDVDKIGYETINVAASLTEQHKVLCERLKEYSSDPTSPAYISIQASIAQLEARLEEMGMLYINPENNQKAVVSNIKADVISLPDISASGGNVTISTANVSSAGGSIKAYGTPQASITNNTNLYLQLGNVNVGEKGGIVKINKTNLTFDTSKTDEQNAAALNSVINDINTTKGIASFAAMHGEVGENGDLVINNNYNGLKEYTVNVTHDGTTTPTVVKIMPDIELPNGKSITNLGGNATIHNNKGNILINGILRANNITLTAPNGSIYQNTPENLVNIGGAVEQLVTKTPDGKTVINPTKDDAGSIAGNNIFINALSINVNGLLQSGFEEYYLDTSEFIDKIQKADELFKDGKLAALSDDQVLQQSKDSAFCLSVGGQVFNKDKKYYDYQVPVYYNPSTGTILVGEITNGGGNIYLSGVISSTGNGRIVAMDGAPDVTIKNNNDLAKDIKLYGVNTTGVSGKVTIVDTNKKTETVITRDGAVVKNLLDGTKNNESLTNGNYTYTPGQGLRYVWVTGQDNGKRVFWQRKLEGKWWGLSDPKEVTKDPTHTATNMGESYLESDAKGNVATIEHETRSEEYYTVSQTKQKGEAKPPSTPTVTKWETGLYGFTKHELYEWYVDSTETVTTKNSLNASKDIAVKFIGDGSTVSTISVNSKGSVDVHGNIGSNTLDSIVKITSTNGGIDQDRGAIKSSDVNLTAAGSMNGINIASGDLLNLTVLNTAMADTIYYHNGIGTKQSDGNDITIKTETKTYNGTTLLNGTTGNANNDFVDSFTLNSNSNIEQTSGGLISAAKITLNTDNGAIGSQRAVRVNTADAPMKSSDPLTASLNAQAQGNITFEEVSGDLRIGTIYSNAGDVTLSGTGNLVDALPYDAIVSSGKNEEELIQLWTELGLLDESKVYKTPKVVKTGDTTYSYEYQTEDNGFPAYDEIVAADGKKSYVRKVDKNNNPLFYVTTEVKTIQWDARKIMYGISDAIINPQSGLKPSDKVANIKANNITLNMKDSTGLNSDKVIEYKISELGMSKDLDDLKLLSKSDASSIKWDAANDKVTVHQKLPIGIYFNNDGGKLNINAGQNGGTVSGNAFIEGRKIDSVANSMNITVDRIAAKGNILLNNSMGGIYAANSNSAIKGVDLTINAGTENGPAVYLGTKKSPVNVDLSGLLHTTSTGEINIHQVSKTNDLVIASASAGGDITFTSEKGILGHDSLAKEGTSRGYIRLENNGTTLKLVAKDGNIGNATDGRINVLNVADKKEGQEEDTRKIIVEAHHTDGGKHDDDGSVYIYGNQNPTNEPDPAGTLKIDSINVGQNGTIDLDSLGSIYAVGDTLQADKVKLRAALDVTVTAKNLKLNNVDISAGKHESAESTELVDYGGDVLITGRSVAIGSNGSTISATALKNGFDSLSKGNVTITAIHTSLANGAVVTADQNIALSADTTVDNTGNLTAGKDASIDAHTTVKNTGKIEAGIDATINAVLGITNSGAMTANGGNVDIISTHGSITNTATGDLEAKGGNVTLRSKESLDNKGDAKAFANVVLQSRESSVTNAGGLTATGGSASIDAHTTTNNTGKLEAGTNATITAVEDITNKGELTAKTGNAVIRSTAKGVENSGSMTAGRDATINAVGAITNSGAMTATNGSAAIASTKGTVVNAATGTMTAGTNATILALGNIKNSGDVTANKGRVDIISYNGSIANTATAALEAQGGNVTLQSKTELDNQGDAKAYDNVVLKSEASSVENAGALTATTGGVSIDAATTASNTGKIEANKDATIKAVEDITNKGSLKAEFGKATIISTTKGVDNSGSMTAFYNATINAVDNITNSGAMTANSDVEIISTNGSILNTATADLVAHLGNITVQSKNELENKGDAKATYGVELKSEASSVVNEGALTATRHSASIEAQTTATNSGVITAGTAAIITAGTSATNTAAMTAGTNASINAGSFVTNSGTMTANKGNASITAQEAVNNSGAMNASAITSITAGTTANNTGKMVAGTDATINATGNIRNEGAMTANGGKVEIKSTGGAITNTATADLETKGGNVTLQSKAKLDNKGDAKAYDNVVLKSEASSVENAGNLNATGGNASITAKTDARNSGTINATIGNASIAADASVNNSGTMTAGTAASITAGGSATNTAAMTAGTNATINAVDAITNSGAMTATIGSAAIASTKGTVVNAATGTMTAGTNVTIQAFGNIKNSGAVTANKGRIDVISYNGSIANTDSAALEAKGGNVTIQSKKELENKGDAKASANVVLQSRESSVENAGNLNATSGNASITAKTDARNSGTINATIGNASIAADASVNNSGTMTAGTATSITAGGSATNTAAMTAGTNATITAVEEITNTGKLTAKTGNVVIRSTAKGVDNSGSMTAGRDATINAVGAINNSGAMTATNGSAAITSTKGTVVNAATGTMTAGTYARITADQDITNNAVITANGGDASISSAKGSIENTASVYAVDYVNIDALEDIDNRGSVTAGTSASINAGECITNSGAMNAGTNASITAGGAVTNSGSMTAKKGNVTITSANGGITNTETADLLANKGNVSMHSKGVLDNAGDLEAKLGTISLQAGYDPIEEETDEDNQQNAMIINTGDVLANGNVSMKAYGHDLAGGVYAVSNSGDVESNGNITMNALHGSVVNVGAIDGYPEGSTTKPQSVVLTANDNIYNGRNVSDIDTTVEAGVVTMNAVNGSVNNYMNVHSTVGETSITAGDSIINRGYLVSDNSQDVLTANNFIENYGHVVAKTDATVSAGTYIKNEGNMSATHDVAITAGTNNQSTISKHIENTGTISAINNASITAKDYINNSGAMLATEGTASITSQNGSVNNAASGYMTSGGDATISAGDSVNNSGSLTSTTNGNVTVNAVNDIVNAGTLVAENGSVGIEAQHGSIYNQDGADLLAGHGNVTIETKAAVGEDKASIINEGDLAANGNITIKSANGDIYNRDDFKVYNGTSIATENVVIYAPNGEVDNNQDIIAANSVDITAKIGLANFAYDVIAGEDIHLTATDGNLINNSELISVSGNIVLDAKNGTVVNLLGGDIFALGYKREGGVSGGNVTMIAGGNAPTKDTPKDSTPYLINHATGEVMGTLAESGITLPSTVDQNVILLSIYNQSTGKTDVYYADNASGNDDTHHYLGSIDGNIDVFRKGDVVNRGDVVAMGETKVNPDGSVETVIPGFIGIRSEHGNVTNYDDFYKVDGKSDIDYEGHKYLMSTGGIGLMAPEGYFYNNLNYFAGGDLVLEAQKGMTIGDDFNIGKVGGNLSVIATDPNEGTIVNRAKEFDVGGNITLDGAAGVTSESAIVAGKGVNLYSQYGDVVIKPQQAGQNVDITATDGLVRIWSENGNVELSGQTVTALKGSVDIGSTNGNTSVDKVIASQMAAVGSKGGNVDANYVKGAEIAFYNGSKDGKTNVDKITVDDFLVVQSNGIKIHEIERGKDGYLYIDATGAGGGTIKDDFNIKVEGNVWFTALNVNNANVVVTGDLAIDKLHVAGKGDFLAHNYKTTVYGKEPAYNGAEAIYYDKGEGKDNPSGIDLEKLIVESNESKQGFDVETGKSKRDDKQVIVNDLEQLLEKKKQNSGTFNKGDNDGWMNLYIDDAQNQRSNGTLLYNSDYHYVHNQRYSAESLSKKLADYKAVDSYELLFTNPFVLFQRYDLYELDNTSFNGNVADGYSLLTEEDLKDSKLN